MRNHDQKIRDMCESVLPSTSRKNARDMRRIAHGTDRASERAALRGAATGRDDYEAVLTDSDRRRRGQVSNLVWDRRSRDKIAPLVRWARASVERDPRLRNAAPQDVLAHFAALLPDNLIGRHALQHIGWGLDELIWRARCEARAAAHAAAAEASRREYRRTLIALMGAGRHGDINRALVRVRAAQDAAIRGAEAKRRGVCDEPPIPVLAGLHHVEDFIAATQDNEHVRKAISRLGRELL